jgi:alpha-glucosidase
VLGNHDQSRIATRLGGQAQARVAAMLKLTLPGMPFIYYGDEIGMEDFKQIPPEKRNDLFGEVSRDPQRTPMQWDTTTYSGFSSHEPWLPVNPNYKKINVETEKEDKFSMLFLYKNLLHLRKTKLSLLDGRYFTVNVEQDNVFSYMRSYGDEQILILLNFSNEKQSFELPYEGELLLNTFLDEKTPSLKRYQFMLRPYEGSMLKVY